MSCQLTGSHPAGIHHYGSPNLVHPVTVFASTKTLQISSFHNLPTQAIFFNKRERHTTQLQNKDKDKKRRYHTDNPSPFHYNKRNNSPNTMSDEFNASMSSIHSSPSWFGNKNNPNSTDHHRQPTDSSFSKFMKKFGRKSEGKKAPGNMQQEWSRRNQMNLSMGVSTPVLDTR